MTLVKRLFVFRLESADQNSSDRMFKKFFNLVEELDKLEKNKVIAR